MLEESLYRRIISGESGAWAMPIRALLTLLAGTYGLGVALRNKFHDQSESRTVPPAEVISVGNLTVGGTGKTPLVIDLVNRLERMGRTPAVLSRGYRAPPDEPNDEERVIQSNCPGVICLADGDRIRAAWRAVHEFGADVLVLDDGFQHRRLPRSIDIVTLDATCPFGYGRLLPRGLLREPIRSLRRAHLIVVTRCDQTSPAELARLDRALKKTAPDVPILKCRHRVAAVERLDGTPVDDSVSGQRAVLFAGIARPGAFVATVQSLDVEVVGQHWWPDHHRYRTQDIDDLLKANRFPPYDVLLTTEKDAAKIAVLGAFDHAPIRVVRVAIDFLDESDSMIQHFLDELFSPDRSNDKTLQTH